MGPHPPPQPPTRWTASGPPAPGGTASSGPCSITSAGIFGLAGGGGRFRTVSPAPGSGLAGVPFSLLSRAFARPRARRLMHILGAGACAPIRPLRGGCPPMGPSRALPRGPARTHGASASGLEGAPLRPLVFTQESRVWPPQRGRPARRRQNKAGRGRSVDTPADGTPSPQARPRSVGSTCRAPRRRQREMCTQGLGLWTRARALAAAAAALLCTAALGLPVSEVPVGGQGGGLLNHPGPWLRGCGRHGFCF